MAYMADYGASRQALPSIHGVRRPFSAGFELGRAVTELGRTPRTSARYGPSGAGGGTQAWGSATDLYYPPPRPTAGPEAAQVGNTYTLGSTFFEATKIYVTRMQAVEMKMGTNEGDEKW